MGDVPVGALELVLHSEEGIAVRDTWVGGGGMSTKRAKSVKTTGTWGTDGRKKKRQELFLP